MIVVSIAIRLFMVLSPSLRPAIIFSRPRRSPAVPFAASPIRLATGAGMPLGSQPSFRQHIRLIRSPRRRPRVSDEYSRRALALHAFAQQREHFLRAFRVEIPGWFVGEHQA